MYFDENKIFYLAGLDLGQAADYSALAIAECSGTSRENYVFNVRHLQRWQLRTSYPTIVADTVRILNSPKLEKAKGDITLAVDATGVGAPVVDLLRRERMSVSLRPVMITGGSDTSESNGFFHVPKRDLVSVVQLALQNGRLKIAEKLPEAATLIRELENFQVKITDSANDTYGAWREGTHDDLVLATALCLWCAQVRSVGIWL